MMMLSFMCKIIGDGVRSLVINIAISKPLHQIQVGVVL